MQQRRATRASSAPLITREVKTRLIVLVIGLVGAGLAAWSMHNSSASARAAGQLGLQRVENNMESILGLLAAPVLMFFGIVAVWSVFELCKIYRAANDPSRFRGKRRKC